MTARPGGQPADKDLSQRVDRLEELQSFGEHALDQISSELVELHRRLGTLVKRLDQLEQRLVDLNESDPAGPPIEKPPHSAGPASV